MLLNERYRYIGLDFETTGLDPTKDEPIQIGIIELDSEGKIIGHYQSLIKPGKKTDELKHIVGFITGLSISDLETAPTMEEVHGQIAGFFGKDAIIIGHNIGFDLNFLERYFPGLEYKTSIDTMQLAQTIVHYAPSYALDVLTEELKSEKLFSETFSDTNHGEEKAHDAFFDTKNAMKLFLYFVKYIYGLMEAYPNLARIIDQTKSIRNEIVMREGYKDMPQIKFQFPALERIMANHTSIAKGPESIDTDELENHKRYYIGNIPIKELLAALASNKQVIFAFNNIQKLDIAKSVLNEIGIRNIGFMKEDQMINQEIFQRFLNKGIFDEEECMFVIKYLSHLKKGLGVLHLNTQSDYRIYHFIKDTRNQSRYPIILTTHHGLFTNMQDNGEIYKEYDICFFDTEQRYKSYNFFLSSPCDLYYTLNILESFLYQQKVMGQIDGTTKESPILQEFINAFQIYIGVLFNESTKLFIKTDATMLQHDPIREHGDFYQSNLLRAQLMDKKRGLQEVLSQENYKKFEHQFDHIQKVFDSMVTISKKMYGNGEFYFTYGEAQKFTDRKEFVDIFKNKVVFFSDTNTQLTKITDTTIPPLTTGSTEGGGGKSIKALPPKVNVLIDYITSGIERSPQDISYFIFSPKKEESKKIFEDLCKNDINKRATLLVENITGGIGKNIFKAKQAKDKILIGGYNFILYCYANRISFKEIILFNARGPSEQNIVDDIRRYDISN